MSHMFVSLLEIFVKVEVRHRTKDYKTISGFGFVTLESRELAVDAINRLNGHFQFGRKIKVNWAVKPTSIPDDVATVEVFFSFKSAQTRNMFCEQTLVDLVAVYTSCPVLDVDIKNYDIDVNLAQFSGSGFLHLPMTIEGVSAAKILITTLRNVSVQNINVDCKVAHSLSDILKTRPDLIEGEWADLGQTRDFVQLSRLTLTPAQMLSTSSLEDLRHLLDLPPDGVDNKTSSYMHDMQRRGSYASKQQSPSVYYPHASYAQHTMSSSGGTSLAVTPSSHGHPGSYSPPPPQVYYPQQQPQQQQQQSTFQQSGMVPAQYADHTQYVQSYQLPPPQNNTLAYPTAPGHAPQQWSPLPQQRQLSPAPQPVQQSLSPIPSMQDLQLQQQQQAMMLYQQYMYQQMQQQQISFQQQQYPQYQAKQPHSSPPPVGMYPSVPPPPPAAPVQHEMANYSQSPYAQSNGTMQGYPTQHAADLSQQRQQQQLAAMTVANYYSRPHGAKQTAGGPHRPLAQQQRQQQHHYGHQPVPSKYGQPPYQQNAGQSGGKAGAAGVHYQQQPRQSQLNINNRSSGEEGGVSVHKVPVDRAEFSVAVSSAGPEDPLTDSLNALRLDEHHAASQGGAGAECGNSETK